MSGLLRWTVGAVLLLAAVEGSGRVKRIVGGRYAEEPRVGPSEEEVLVTPATTTPAEDVAPAVFVNKQRTWAVVNGIQLRDGPFGFLGIRYAKAPVGNLRFRRPVKVKLEGVVNAVKYGPPCPQWWRRQLFGEEDCLFLNVYSPQVSTEGSSQSFPVLFWIHGGNFKTGSASQYLPLDLVKKGVVVVTAQYRLGSLGYLCNGNKDLSGNAGLFDLAAALDWTRRYIRHFGGDPTRITASGQGSGATAATYLGFNKHYRSSLRGIFAMSGAPVSPFSLDENETRTAKETAEQDGCNAEEGLAFFKCMQNASLETVMKGDIVTEEKRKERYDLTKELSNLLTPGPVTEGKDDDRFLPNFLTQTPLEALQGGKFPKIPLLTGVTKDETSGGVNGNFLDELKSILNPTFLKGDLFKNLLNANTGLYVNKAVNPSLSKLFNTKEYVNFFTSLLSSALSGIEQVIQHTTDAFFNLPAFLTSHLWSQKNNAYLYSFEHKGKSHASSFLNDLPLISGKGPSEGASCSHGDDLIYLFDIQSLDGKPTASNSNFSDADKKVRDHFTTMVAEFARSGVPKTAEGSSWEPFTKESGNYMVINETPKLAKGFRKCTMALWTGDSNILSSAECGLAAAGKLVTDTLGSAGTKLLDTAVSVENQIGTAVGGVTTGIKDAGKKTTSALTNTTTGALGALGIGRRNNTSGNTKPLGGLLGGGTATPPNKKPSSGGVLGILG